MAKHAKRLTLMPIPPVEEQTRFFDAGSIAIGVEYRLLNEDIVKQNVERQQQDFETRQGFEDRGVSLHVFAVKDDGGRLEHLRFDCFDEGPHYHYVNWQEGANDIVQIDDVADGDPLAWALDRIRTRLPHMLARAGAEDAAGRVDPSALEAILPQVSEAAYRARYHHDAEAILEGALA